MTRAISPATDRTKILSEAPEDDRVLLAHGGGGELTGRLIREQLLPHFANDILNPLNDSAVLPWSASDVVFTTDSYVVTPLEFPGGNIGTLAVCGTVNDLAVMGARPVALSLGMIIEEGLSFDVLARITRAIAASCKEAGVQIVTGDTKVIERRRGDGLFINTAGVGQLLPEARLDLARVKSGDVIICNGEIANHGLTIMSLRGGLAFKSQLKSDAAPLNGLIAEMLATKADIKFMRDATRGGLAGVLTDVSDATRLSIEIDESRIPISTTARHAAEMLGLDPLTIANEGKLVCFVSPDDAGALQKAMREHPLGRMASIIGKVTAIQPGLVELRTVSGGQRIIQRPYGEDLPRIC